LAQGETFDSFPLLKYPSMLWVNFKANWNCDTKHYNSFNSHFIFTAWTWDISRFLLLKCCKSNSMWIQLVIEYAT
jgi:hypothetical protein